MAHCPEYRRHIEAYADGELNPARTESVRRHLTQCDDCRRRLEALSSLDASLRDLPVPAPPAGLAGRIGAQARRRLGQPPAGLPVEGLTVTLRWWRQSVWAARLAAATLLIAVCLAGAYSGIRLHDYLANTSPPADFASGRPDPRQIQLDTYTNTFSFLPQGSPAKDYLALLGERE